MIKSPYQNKLEAVKVSEKQWRTRLAPNQVNGLPENLKRIDELEKQVRLLTDEIKHLKESAVTHEQLEKLVMSATETYKAKLAEG